MHHCQRRPIVSRLQYGSQQRCLMFIHQADCPIVHYCPPVPVTPVPIGLHENTKGENNHCNRPIAAEAILQTPRKIFQGYWSETVAPRLSSYPGRDLQREGGIPHCSATSHLLQWPKTILGGEACFPGHCLKVINIKELYGVI